VRARALLVLLLLQGRAHAYPLLAPRPVASAIAGPADPHVAAAFYNPAALGPLRHVHVWVEGDTRLHEGTIDRDAGAGHATTNYADFEAFTGVAWDLGTDNKVTIGLATFTPFVDLTSYGDSPVRYQVQDQLFITYQQTLAAAIKISSRFFLGVSGNFAETWMRWRFDRDTVLAGGTPAVQMYGYENPATRQNIRLRGFGWGGGFSVGVLGRPVDRLWLAASYISRIFNTQSEDLLVDERGTQVAPCTTPGSACVGNGSLTLAIPDIVYLAARVEVTLKLDLEASLRWVHYGTSSAQTMRTQGGNLGLLPPDRALPPEQQIDRGLQDAWGAEVSARFQVRDSLRLAPSLMFESSAVDATAVSAAALDAPKLDFALTLEWRPVRHFVIGAHAGGTAYFVDHVQSRYSPQAATACVDAQYSLNACRAMEDGAALPTASGGYTHFVVHLGAAVGVDY
jgi:long-subunit fatty acid transport protein